MTSWRNNLSFSGPDHCAWTAEPEDRAGARGWAETARVMTGRVPMIEAGYLEGDVEAFEALMARCGDLQTRINAACRAGSSRRDVSLAPWPSRPF
jgi:hypothetical protein